MAAKYTASLIQANISWDIYETNSGHFWDEAISLLSNELKLYADLIIRQINRVPKMSQFKMQWIKSLQNINNYILL